MTRRESSSGILPSMIVLLTSLLFAGIATAAPPGSVSVDLGIVVASNQGTEIDPSLSTLRTKLQSMFTYTSYKMLDRLKRTIAVGGTGEFGLPGGRSMRVTPVTAPEKKIRLAVQINEGGRNLLSTTLGLSPGGMVLVGGPPYQSGVLILIISAE